MSHIEDSKRIAKNSIYLYIRSIVIMIVTLYTSRIVLKSLGFTDYGIYVVVGSVVVMFNMFSATFMSATQRFLNIEMGKGDVRRVRKVFSAALNIHFVLAFIIFILLESIGLWLLNTKMTIPGDRIIAANWVYQFSVLTFLINLISLPYNAVIIANERMGVYAYVSVYEAVMKLVIVAGLLLWLFDRLILYSFLLLLVALSIRLFYGWYCRKYFDECKYEKVKDKELYKDILSISGWNFLGSGASILSSSASGLILNYFTSVIVNSANGIASQVTNAVTQLLQNFMVSLRPQITKSYAIGDNQYMLQLVSKGTRFSFFLSSFLCFPIISESEQILKLWLGNIPPYTVIFVQLSLVYILQSSFSTILDMVLMATGRVKYSQIWLSVGQLLNVPLMILFFLSKLPPYFIVVSSILISYLTLGIRIFFTLRYTEMDLKFYLIEVVWYILKPIIIVLVTLYLVAHYLSNNGIVMMIGNFLLLDGVLAICFYFLGTTQSEKKYLNSRIKKIIKRNE